MRARLFTIIAVAALVCSACALMIVLLASMGCDGGFRPRYVCNPADFGCTQPFWTPPVFWDGAYPGTDDAGVVR